MGSSVEEYSASRIPYSEMSAIGKVINHLPTSCSLHLANSSTVRYAQLFPLPNDVEVLSNRGTNGIEGSLSTAIGYATASDKLNFIFIGDLSFFYDMNALWNANYGSNVRILLLNNEGEKYSMRFRDWKWQTAADASLRPLTALPPKHGPKTGDSSIFLPTMKKNLTRR